MCNMYSKLHAVWLTPQMKNEICGRQLHACISFIYDTLMHSVYTVHICAVNCYIHGMSEWEQRVSKQETIWYNNNIVYIKCWWLLCVLFFFLLLLTLSVHILGLIAPTSTSCLFSSNILFMLLFLCNRSTATTLIVFKCIKLIFITFFSQCIIQMYLFLVTKRLSSMNMQSYRR